jgi:hypothetical protein
MATKLAITFTAALAPPAVEQMGCNLNYTMPAMNNGDVFPDNPTLAAQCNAYRANNVVTWIPGLHGRENLELEQNGKFTAFGKRATYLMFQYGVGITRPDGTKVPLNQQLLNVVNQGWVTVGSGGTAGTLPANQLPNI